MPDVWFQEKRAGYLQASRTRESIPTISPALHRRYVGIDEHSVASQVQVPTQVQPTPPVAAQLRANRLRDPVGDENVQRVWMSFSFSVRDKAGHLRRTRCRYALKLHKNVTSVSINQNRVRLVWLATFHNGQTKIFYQLSEDLRGLQLFQGHKHESNCCQCSVFGVRYTPNDVQDARVHLRAEHRWLVGGGRRDRVLLSGYALSGTVLLTRDLRSRKNLPPDVAANVP